MCCGCVRAGGRVGVLNRRRGGGNASAPHHTQLPRDDYRHHHCQDILAIKNQAHRIYDFLVRGPVLRGEVLQARSDVPPVAAPRHTHTLRHTSPHLASPHLASPRHISPRLANHTTAPHTITDQNPPPPPRSAPRPAQRTLGWDKHEIHKGEASESAISEQERKSMTRSGTSGRSLRAGARDVGH